MHTKGNQLFSLILCIAVASLLLQFTGGITPAGATRGFIHGTITAADYAPNSPPIRGITVFIARTDGSSPLTLRTDASGKYTTGVIDDRGIGFTVHVNKADVAGYNNRYESATAANVLFSPTDRDGEKRDFALHGSSSATPTPTATATPTQVIPTLSPTTTPTTVIPTVTVTATPTPDGGDDEAGGGDEPDGPSQDRTVRLEGYVYYNREEWPLNKIPVYFWRQDGGNSFYRETNETGYFSAEVEYFKYCERENPQNCYCPPTNSRCYNIAVNKDNHDSRHPKQSGYDSRIWNNVMPDGDLPAHPFYLKDGWVTIGGQVLNKSIISSGIPVPNITVYGRHLDNGTEFFVSTDKDGKWTQRIERFYRSINPEHMIVLVANRDDPEHPSNPWYLNSTETVHPVEPNDDKPAIATLELVKTNISFKGRVIQSGTSRGVPEIPMSFEREDGIVTYTKTNSSGYFSAVLRGSTSVDVKVTANKGGPGYPSNSSYSVRTTDTNLSLTFDHTNDFYLVYNPVITITSVEPSVGVRGDVVTIVINGANFNNEATVKFIPPGYKPRSSPFYIFRSYLTSSSSITTIVAIPTDAVLGDWTVKVTNPDGKYASAKFMVIDSWLPGPIETLKPGPTPKVTVMAAEMISPTELGVAAVVTFPDEIPDSLPRKIFVDLTIDGKRYTKEFPADFAKPGEEWGLGTFSLDTIYLQTHVNPNTPLRFDIEKDLGLDKFKDDKLVKVEVSASYEGCMPSPKSVMSFTIPLPVLFYHGWMNTIFRGAHDISDDSIQLVAYEPVSEKMLLNGYNRDKEWTDLLGIKHKKYLTLWDTGTGLTYTTSEAVTEETLLRQVDTHVNTILASSYASRVNIIGHSTGGLIGVYYASKNPEKVARVITVAAPLEGVEDLYRIHTFDNDWWSLETEPPANREEAERFLFVRWGPDLGKRNIIPWYIPKWEGNLTSPAIDAGLWPDWDPYPFFENTFNYEPNDRVDYHFIYGTTMDTPKSLKLALNTDRQWWHVMDNGVIYGKGDGTVLIDSGKNSHVPYAPNIHRRPINNVKDHAFICTDPNVVSAVWESLKTRPSQDCRAPEC